MSFVVRAAPITTRAAIIAATRSAPALAVATSRSLHASARLQKNPVDATKDTLKKADRVVSDAAVKGIEKGEQAGQKIKETVGYGSEEARAKAEEMKGEASHMAGQGKGKAEEMMGEVKGKAKETYGEAKGKANEVSGKMSS